MQMLDSRKTGEVTYQDFCRYITLLPDAQVGACMGAEGMLMEGECWANCVHTYS